MLRRAVERLPPERGERVALLALAAILSGGALLRLWLMIAVRPSFVGYADSYAYIAAAEGRLFGDQLRPAGYPLFLRAMHWLNANLSFTTLVQHGLGLLSALLLYGAARRFGLSRWWSLLPAGVVALAGPQVMIEHATLTEAVFIALQSAALYCLARAVGDRDWAWALGAGLLAGASVTVRALGLLLVAAIAVCLIAGAPGIWWRRVARVAATAGAALLVIGGYVYAHHEDTGYTGLTRAGSYNFYGRVAPFADCGRFDPPAGTRRLCESTSSDERPGPNSYIFGLDTSPAIREFGAPFQADREANEKVGAFARAAALHQPFDLLEMAVTEDLLRYVSSEHVSRGGQGLSFDSLQDTLVSDFQAPQTIGLIGTYYSTNGQLIKDGPLDAFRSYERVTRPTGVLFAALALLALIGAVLAPPGLRRGAAAFGLVALVSILGPPLTLFYDARYAIPAFGPLAGAAAIGGAALTERVARRRARRRPA